MNLVRALLFLLILAIALPLAGCGKADSASSGGASGVPAPLAEVRLGYFANITHAQAVLGVASGDFQKALGATSLTTKVFNAGPELIQALNAGAIDIGYVGPGPVIAAHVNSGGQAVRVISGAAADGIVIVAGKDSGIQKIEDLKGKQIATPQFGNTQDVAARHYVTAVLGQTDSNNVKGVPNSQQAGLMVRGTFDAAWVPEPWASRLISQVGAIPIAEEKDLWPDHEFSLTVIVTTPTFLADHPDVIEKILNVHHDWTQKLSQHPNDYADQLNNALVSLGGKKLPSDILTSALARTKFTDNPLEKTFTTMGQWSYQLKFIKSSPDLTGLFEESIIQKIDAATPTTQP